MSDKCYSANHVERTYKVLSAINLLSISAKLTLLKANNPIDARELSQARRQLLEFTTELSSLIEKADRREGRTILGTDRRMSELVSQVRQLTQSSSSDTSIRLTLDDLPHLLEAEDESHQAVLVQYLDQLRSLVEQHAYSDMVAVFGESWS